MLPAKASRSSKSFPVKTFPRASTYKSRRLAEKYEGSVYDEGCQIAAKCDVFLPVCDFRI